MSEFLSPYATAKFLEGVLEALPKVRGNFFQTSLFNGFETRDTKTVNFDEEFAVNNVSAMFVNEKADVTPIELGTYGHKELYFAYTKEGWGDDDFDTLDQRQMGDAFGQVNVLANNLRNLQTKAAIAELRIQNLLEVTSTNLAKYGSYLAYSEKHPKILYDFGREVITTAADLTTKELIPSVNLTTTAVTTPWGATAMPVVATSGGFTAGDKMWTKAKVTAGTATPWKDVVKMVQTSRRYSGNPQAIVMQATPYDVFNFDIETNYKDAADTTVQVLLNLSRDVVPQIKNVDGLTFRRNISMGDGTTLPVYTYEAKLNDRKTAVEASILEDGWVMIIPASNFGKKIYGRIKHKAARYQAMPRFIHRWTHPKTSADEYEMHSSFLLGHTKINSLVAWKVS